MKFLLTTTLSLACLMAIGQSKPGIITTLDNQILTGLIELVGPEKASRICRFQETTSSEVVEFTPQQIQGYRIIGENPYYSGAISDDGVIKFYFFELLVGGALNAYALNKQLVLSNESGEFTMLTPANYKDMLSSRLSGCNYAQSAIPKLKFEKAALTRIIRVYNECIKSANPETFRPKKVIDAAFGLFVGIDDSTLDLPTNSSVPALSGVNLSNIKPMNIGTEVWLNSPALSNKFRVILGINYTQRQFNGVTTYNGTDYANNIYFTEFSVPVRLQYTILQRKSMSWFVTAGTAFSLVTDFSSSQIWDTQVGNDIYTNEVAPYSDLEKSPAFYSGLGCTFDLSKRRRIVMSLSYMSATGTFRTDPNTSPTGTFTSYSFTGGFLF